MPRTRPLLVAACLAMLVGSCSSGGTTSEQDPTTSTTEPVSTSPDDTEIEDDGGSAGTSSSTTVSTGEPVWFFDHLDVGDCWDEVYDEAGDPDRSGVPVDRSCSEPHLLEVIGAFRSDADEYPGEDALGDLASEECSDAFSSYIGVDYQQASGIGGFTPKPTEEQWLAGARRMVCVAYFEQGRVASSFEGIGSTEPLPYDLPASTPIPDGATIWALSDTEDGDRYAGYDLPMGQDDAVVAIAAEAAAGGWTVESQVSASNSVVLELAFEGDRYTFIVRASDEDDPSESSLAVYYPPGPLPSVPNR